jgi:hypothetical protein
MIRLPSSRGSRQQFAAVSFQISLGHQVHRARVSTTPAFEGRKDMRRATTIESPPSPHHGHIIAIDLAPLVQR